MHSEIPARRKLADDYGHTPTTNLNRTDQWYKDLARQLKGDGYPHDKSQ